MGQAARWAGPPDGADRAGPAASRTTGPTASRTTGQAASRTTGPHHTAPSNRQTTGPVDHTGHTDHISHIGDPRQPLLRPRRSILVIIGRFRFTGEQKDSNDHEERSWFARNSTSCPILGAGVLPEGWGVARKAWSVA